MTTADVPKSLWRPLKKGHDSIEQRLTNEDGIDEDTVAVGDDAHIHACPFCPAQQADAAGRQLPTHDP